MSDWPLLQWFEKHTGKPCWMVCRNGHLWQADVPYAFDFDEQYTVGSSRARVQAVTRCKLCRLLKESGAKKLRGITQCHPDYAGKITGARMLANGTIEHHHPEQVAKAYRVECVKEWRAAMALIGLQASRYRRGTR